MYFIKFASYFTISNTNPQKEINGAAIIQEAFDRKFSSFIGVSFERRTEFKQIWNVRGSPKLSRMEDYTEILFLFVFFHVIPLYLSAK